jgi:hypothetical protein
MRKRQGEIKLKKKEKKLKAGDQTSGDEKDAQGMGEYLRGLSACLPVGMTLCCLFFSVDVYVFASTVTPLCKSIWNYINIPIVSLLKSFQIMY